MAITKPPVLPSWAEAGDKIQPSNADIQVGWPLSSIPPSRQRFNWLLNFLANGIRYFSRRGLPDYDAAETYMTGDRIIGDDGKTYRSIHDANIGNTPSLAPAWWEEWAPSLSRLADLLQKQTYTAFTTAGAAPNFTLTPSPAIAAYSAGQRFRVKFHAAGTGADVLNVGGLGNKSLKQYDSAGAKVAAVIAVNQLTDVEYDGVDMVLLDPLTKSVTAASDPTFADSGVNPASTSWVRGAMTAIATAAGFVFSPGDVVTSGYIKFPSWLGGLIVQWGRASVASNGSTITLPIAYPTKHVRAFTQYGDCNPAGSAESVIGPGVVGQRTLTNFVGKYQLSTGVNTATAILDWWSLGY